jgi:hypothetical protein
VDNITPICNSERSRMSQDEPELPSMSQHEPAPACCCNRNACIIGTFESIFTVMKESMFPPHVLDIDWSMSNITGDLTKGAIQIIRDTFSALLRTFLPLCGTFVVISPTPFRPGVLVSHDTSFH